MLPKTLNWYNIAELIPQLEEKMGKSGRCEIFKTIRIGKKYAHGWDPGDTIEITIADPGETPRVLGTASVLSLKKVSIRELSKSDLAQNIGKTTMYTQVLETMKRVYNDSSLTHDTIVTVIKLIGN